MSHVAFITGASRGLGLATARALAAKGHLLVLGVRKAAERRAELLKSFPNSDQVQFVEFDAARPDSLAATACEAEAAFGRIDILVNNAGVFLDGPFGGDGSALKTTPKILLDTLTTNTVAPMALMQALLPGMMTRGFGRIVNVSSGMGQLSKMEGGYPAYRASKSALNALTKIFAKEAQGKNVLVNSVCPGWVRTDMGGPKAMRSPDEGIRGIVWAATLPDGGPTGGFFRDGHPLAW